MSQPLYAVYGASGYGREVMPLAREQLDIPGLAPDRLIFVDDMPVAHTLNGHRVLTYDEFLAVEASDRFVDLRDDVHRRRRFLQFPRPGDAGTADLRASVGVNSP